MVAIKCPHCDKVLNVPQEKLGKVGRCPQCRKPFTASATPTETKAVSPPPLPTLFRTLAAKSRKIPLWMAALIGGLVVLTVVASIIVVISVPRSPAVASVAPVAQVNVRANVPPPQPPPQPQRNNPIANVPPPPPQEPNPALSKMNHKMTAMPSAAYSRIKAAIDKQDAEQVAKLLNGIDGYSLFTKSEIEQLGNPHPVPLPEKFTHTGTIYYQCVDSGSQFGSFYWPNIGKNGYEAKDVGFTHHDAGYHDGHYWASSMGEGAWLDGIHQITFQSSRRWSGENCVETDIEVNDDGKPTEVRCHGTLHTEKIGMRIDIPREGTPSIVSDPNATYSSSDKVYKIVFDCKAGTYQITKGDY